MLVAVPPLLFPSKPFPSVVATAQSTWDDSGSSFPVNLPAGIAAGRLILIFGGQDGNGRAASAPGYTSLYDASAGSGAMWCLYKIAAGGEGATVTVSLGGGGMVAGGAVSVLVKGNSASAPAKATVTAGVDPPSLNAGSVKNYLWIAALGQRQADGEGPFLSGPSGWNGYLEDSTDHAAYAWLQSGAQTVDPPVFSVTTNSNVGANTIAIAPA